MFGYVRTDIPNMYVKDTVLYRSMYCGLCKSIGKTCGQKARFALNYDLTFLSCLFHNIVGLDVKIERQRCVLHQIIKREIAVTDPLTERIARLNTILTYHKLTDDVIDSGKSKVKRSFFKKGYKRAKNSDPILEDIVSTNYQKLVEYEKKGEGSIDISADFFGQMMKEITIELLGEKNTFETEELGYMLGKWIYLIDALDDFDEDKKKGQYNPFVITYSEEKNKEEFLKNKSTDLNFIFGTVIENIRELTKKITYAFNHDLTDNILMRGLAVKTKQIMENKKCKKTSKF